MGNRILDIKDIRKSFDNLEVMKEISLYLQEGEIVALFGPSGCGKTTLFRLIAGLEEPDSGQINLAPQTRLAYSFQEPRLLPWKTVDDNIFFVQQNFLSDTEAEDIRAELLDYTQLTSFKNSYPAQLSGGMKQRLELLRALSIKPDLLLMDEPFKSLDYRLKIKLREMLLDIWLRDRFGMLLISHDPEEAVMLADRIYLISGRPGRITGELEIDRPQQERSLKDEDIYNYLDRILAIF